MGNCNTCSIKLFYQGLGRGGKGGVVGVFYSIC